MVGLDGGYPVRFSLGDNGVIGPSSPCLNNN
jgi:hypothetical protein